jgi:protocatechuate 3,4-dioxygenase beta subunit
MDRMAHQSGYLNYGTSGTSTYEAFSSGDVLRAHNNNGTYQLENNGIAGSLVGQNGNGEGPGGHEFYDDDMGVYDGSTNVHPETSLGGLTMLPGSQKVATNAYDPLPISGLWRTNGVMFMSNINGDKVSSYEAIGTANTVGDGFGKAGSMGDIELLTEPAPIEIGNRVWWDIDGDGVQDAGEPGLANVAVTLNGPDGSLVVNTNASGNYYHSQSATTGAYSQTLRPNTTYTLTVNPTGLSDYTLTVPNAQGAYDHNAFSDIRDSDAYIVSGLATIYYRTGNAGENNHGLDFGFTKAPAATVLITNTYTIKASIGDRVWQDNDGDGVQDNNEPGLPGVTVQLMDSTNTVISTTTTNSNGNYTFSELQPGNYTVVFVKPANYDPSPKDSPSTTDALDSDADPVTGQAPVTLVVGEQNTTTDAGFIPFKGTIGDRVWLDADQNGQQNSEDGIENVTVRLINSSNFVISTTTTNSGGGYQFAGLNPGTYYVEFVLPGGYSFTTKDVGNDLTDSDAITTTGRTDAIILTPGQVNNSVDAGLIQINGMCIGNLVFGDANENGVFDGIDPRVANRRVRLYTDGATNTELASMLTNSQGEYQFCGLAPGDYIVAILPADVPGFYGSPSAASANSDIDNDNNGSAGTLSGGVPAIRTTTITLVANAEPTTEDGNNNTNLTIDIGMWKE